MSSQFYCAKMELSDSFKADFFSRNKIQAGVVLDEETTTISLNSTIKKDYLPLWESSSDVQSINFNGQESPFLNFQEFVLFLLERVPSAVKELNKGFFDTISGHVDPENSFSMNKRSLNGIFKDIKKKLPVYQLSDSKMWDLLVDCIVEEEKSDSRNIPRQKNGKKKKDKDPVVARYQDFRRHYFTSVRAIFYSLYGLFGMLQTQKFHSWEELIPVLRTKIDEINQNNQNNPKKKQIAFKFPLEFSNAEEEAIEFNHLIFLYNFLEKIFMDFGDLRKGVLLACCQFLYVPVNQGLPTKAKRRFVTGGSDRQSGYTTRRVTMIQAICNIRIIKRSKGQKPMNSNPSIANTDSSSGSIMSISLSNGSGHEDKNLLFSVPLPHPPASIPYSDTTSNSSFGNSHGQKRLFPQSQASSKRSKWDKKEVNLELLMPLKDDNSFQDSDYSFQERDDFDETDDEN